MKNAFSPPLKSKLSPCPSIFPSTFVAAACTFQHDDAETFELGITAVLSLSHTCCKDICCPGVLLHKDVPTVDADAVVAEAEIPNPEEEEMLLLMPLPAAPDHQSRPPEVEAEGMMCLDDEATG